VLDGFDEVGIAYDRGSSDPRYANSPYFSESKGLGHKVEYRDASQACRTGGGGGGGGGGDKPAASSAKGEGIFSLCLAPVAFVYLL
jgi:hypothetical protein